MDPGIHERNSRLLKLFSLAKLASLRSKVAAPAIKMSSLTNSVKENS